MSNPLDGKEISQDVCNQFDLPGRRYFEMNVYLGQ